MKRTIIMYGLILGALIFVLKAIEYRYLLSQLGVEVYLGIVALICTAFGIWLGFQLISRGKRSSTMLSQNPSTDVPHLSNRESDVLRLIADGCSNQEIADRLFISVHTVKTHSSNLFAKIGRKT